MDRSRQLGGEARVEVGVDDDRDELEAIDPDLLLRAVRLGDCDLDRLRREPIGDSRQLAGEVLGCGAAASVRAKSCKCRRHGTQNIRAERIRQLADFFPQYVERQRYTAKMKTLAQKNGHSHRHTEAE